MPTRTVIIVDDDQRILSALSMTMRDEGWETTTAASGETALAIMEKREFSLAIIDLVMRRISGMDLLRTIRERFPMTCCIILTGYGDLRSAIEALRLGADDYLLKPCDPDELCIRAFRCVEKREQGLRLAAIERILPVCCVCKRIRDDSGHARGEGSWHPIESFILTKTGIEVSSTYCPECLREAEEEVRAML